MRTFFFRFALISILLSFYTGAAYARHVAHGHDAAGRNGIAQILADAGAYLKSMGGALWSFEPAAGRVGSLEMASPAVALSRPAQVSHGAFQSVAIPVGRIGLVERWQQVRQTDQRGFYSSECETLGFDNCNSAFAVAARALVADTAGRDPLDIIAMVNARVNRAITYIPDIGNWGVADRWATPAELARNGLGDCEDYAIAKLWLLRAVGFDEDQLQLVILQDTRRQVYHAVLVAHVGGARFILDNLSDSVRADTALPNYLPLVSFAGDKSFLHGFDARRTVTAMPADLGTVSPGEGI